MTTLYTKLVDFASKDALATGNPLKQIVGAEHDDEYNAIQTAFTALGSSSGSANVGHIASGTGAVATTVQTKLRESDSILDKGTGTAADLSEAMASLTSGGEILIPKGAYTFSGSITCSNAHVTVRCADGVTIAWSGLGANVSAIVAAANNFTWLGGVITGPSSAAYVANERFISMTGTSSASRLSGLTVKGAEILNFGSDGVYAKWVSGVHVSDCSIHNIGYQGVVTLSCDFVRIRDNHIYTITPGTASNTYGVICTHDSTLYSGDPNAGTKAALNPFCWDVVISDNWVEDVAWIGIDFHGAYDSVVTNNRIYNTRQGISVSGSSGSAAAYAGWNNQITNNLVDSRTSLGAAGSRQNLDFGINLNGGSTVNHSNVVCTGNIIYGHGILGNSTSGSIQATYVKNADICNNIIEAWGGNGIYYANSAGLFINGNTFLQLGGAAAGLEYAIGADGEVTSNTITQNTLLANGGTAGRIGYRANTLTTMPLLSQNNFNAATVASYILPTGNSMSADAIPAYAYTVNNAGGGETINISTMQRYGAFRLNVTSSDAASTVTNLTNGVTGQIVYLYSVAATAWTFTRNNAALAGGTTFVASIYDLLVLQYNGTLWIELSRSANS